MQLTCVAHGAIIVLQEIMQDKRWFDGEMPTPREIALAYENLGHYGNEVDYFLTHKYSPEMQRDDVYRPEGFVRHVDTHVTFKHGYAGHWQRHGEYDEKHTIVHHNLTELS